MPVNDLSFVSPEMRRQIVKTYEYPYHDTGLPPGHLRVLAQKLLEQGDADKVIEWFQMPMAELPEECFSALTAAHCQRGDYARAAEVNDEAIRRAEGADDVGALSDALAYRAKIVFKTTHSLPPAVTLLKQALQANPTNDMAMANLICYASKARDDAALNDAVYLLKATWPRWRDVPIFVHILKHDADLAWGRKRQSVRELLSDLR